MERLEIHQTAVISEAWNIDGRGTNATSTHQPTWVMMEFNSNSVGFESGAGQVVLFLVFDEMTHGGPRSPVCTSRDTHRAPVSC